MHSVQNYALYRLLESVLVVFKVHNKQRRRNHHTLDNTGEV